MPAVVIEAVPRGSAAGYELGNGAIETTQDVKFHVLAEDRRSRNEILDIFRLQFDKIIWLFDSQAIAVATGYPLDYRGMLVGSNMYPDLVDVSGFRWKECRFSDTFISEVESFNPNIYQGVVRTTFDIIVGSV
jgi:hypothetical protein